MQRELTFGPILVSADTHLFQLLSTLKRLLDLPQEHPALHAWPQPVAQQQDLHQGRFRRRLERKVTEAKQNVERLQQRFRKLFNAEIFSAEEVSYKSNRATPSTDPWIKARTACHLANVFDWR